MRYKQTKYNCIGTLFYERSFKKIQSGNNKNRIKRNKPTTEQQKKINENNSVNMVTRILQMNFKGGDLHIILTYKNENYPDTVQAIRKNKELFIRRLAYAYKKHGYELRYIQATEYKKKRVHHHMIINAIPEISAADIQNKIWKKGFVKSTPLEDNGYYEPLAQYLVKETSMTFNTNERVYAQRYTTSRNIKRPEKEITYIEGNESDFYTVPQIEGNYALIKESFYQGINEYTGTIYIKYAMKLIPERKNKKNRRKHTKILTTQKKGLHNEEKILLRN